MINFDYFKKAAITLMETAPCIYLATINDDGYPYIRCLFNLRNKEQFPQLKAFFQKQDDFLTYISTNTSSKKLNQIRVNPNVSVYYCRPEEFFGLMFPGRIEIVDEISVKKALWIDGWERYYPTGVEDPDYTVLRLKPTLARGWYKSNKFEFTVG
jgi:general stress protein 26